MRRTIETKAADRALTLDELTAFLTALAEAGAPPTVDITARVTIAAHVKSIQATWEVEEAPRLLEAAVGGPTP